jgi:hypothetical protein
MKRQWVCGVAAVWMLVGCVFVGAKAQAQESTQDRGYWEAASHTAKDITGDISISELKLSISFSRFTIAQIRQLTPAEATATFGADTGARGGGNLYRLEVPAEKRFAHHNTLCGGQETQWMATWSDGRTLQVAFFSQSTMPVLTADALAQSGNVCELLAYVR